MYVEFSRYHGYSQKYTTRTADKYAYGKEIAPLNDVPIFSRATAWDYPASGKTFIIVTNDALYYGTKLDNSLMNPNQIRAYGVPFWDNPYDKERGLTTKVDDTVNIQMNTMDTKIQFETRSSTLNILLIRYSLEI